LAEPEDVPMSASHICQDCAKRRGAVRSPMVERRTAKHEGECPCCREVQWLTVISDWRWPFPRINLKNA